MPEPKRIIHSLNCKPYSDPPWEEGHCRWVELLDSVCPFSFLGVGATALSFGREDKERVVPGGVFEDGREGVRFIRQGSPRVVSRLIFQVKFILDPGGFKTFGVWIAHMSTLEGSLVMQGVWIAVPLTGSG